MKIAVKKKKKRIPIPQKPPKVENKPKTYNRKKEKTITKGEILEGTSFDE
ncbi:MAG: hypothetical protein HXY50_05115 [Ignavibacteriaceae bacterium]|nr:hypothetical protein [Ignavibacteriaceae bacterium]